MALGFGAIYALVLVGSAWLSDRAGSQGLYAVAVASGPVDVDAITLSIADTQAAGMLGAGLAVGAIAVAVAVNTLVKIGLVAAIAGARAGLAVAAIVTVVAVVLAARDAAGRDQAGDHLGAADAVVLGVVEGLTEWLPISSTGHLTVTQDLLRIDGDAADSYAIAIQSGAILAVLLLFRERFETMFRGIQGKDPQGRAVFIAVVLACVPAATIGLTAEDTIKDNLFGTGPVVVAWFVGGLVILAVARYRRGLDPAAGDPLTALTWQKALVIGCAQSLALWPGVSRSLVTIIAATLLGLSILAAVEFSFLLGFVTLGGATAYELVSSGEVMLEAYGLAMPLLGLAVAFVSAVAAMRWMVGYLQHHSLAIFGWYRIALALLVGLLLATGAV